MVTGHGLVFGGFHIISLVFQSYKGDQ